MSQSPSGIGQQGVDRTADALGCLIQPVDALAARKIGLHGVDRLTQRADLGRRGFDFRLVRGDQKIKTGGRSISRVPGRCRWRRR